MNTDPPSPTAPRHLAGGAPADDADFILRRRYEVVRETLGKGGDLLLDFGCGNGAQTRWFAPHFRRVVGVDVGREHLRGFARRAREDGPEAIPRLGVQYDGRALPLADDSVDAVVSFEVLEHVEDEHAALSEIHRVLRPGGRLALSVPNRWWIFETHGADLPLLPWNRVPLFSWLPKPIHDRWARARIYRRREIVAALRDHGFEVERSAYLTAPMDVVAHAGLRRWLRGTLFRPHLTPVPVLATAVLVIARKGVAEAEAQTPGRLS